jgi:hypothetical protein
METPLSNCNGNVPLGHEDALQVRLEELRREFQTGEVQLEALEHRRAQVRDTLLRISGAIQVLEEVLHQTQTEKTARVTCASPESTWAQVGQE